MRAPRRDRRGRAPQMPGAAESARPRRRRNGDASLFGACLELRGEFVDFSFLLFDEGQPLLHLGWKPSFARIFIIAAARLLRTITGQKRPILRTVIVKPEAIFFDDQPKE